jgi:hypothetical protein
MPAAKQATPTQYQAQNLSMDWLANSNKALEYQNQMFKDLLKEGRYTQERSAQESAKQRTSDETRSLYGANGQVNSSVAQAQGQIGAASENSRANVMNAQLARDQDNRQVNTSMGFDAKGNVMAIPIDGGGGGGRSGGGGSSSSSSSSSSSGFGKWGGGPMQIAMFGPSDYTGMNNFAKRTYEEGRNQAATTARMITEAEAAGDILRAKEQSKLDLARSSAEASIKARSDASLRAFQAQQSGEDRANQRYLAGVDANSRLFASLNQGQGGFQYWGGSI